MKVALLIQHGKIGGIELHVLTLALGLIERGDEPIVVMLFGGGPLIDLLDQHEIGYVTLGGRNGHDPRALYRLFTFLRRQLPDILHVHAVSFVVASMLVFWRKPKVVVTEHMSKLGRKVPWRTKLLWRLLYFRSEKVICVSNSTKSAVLDVFPQLQSRAVTVYNGISESSTDSADAAKEISESPLPKQLIVGAVGRLAEGKGWMEFLEIAREVCAVIPNVRFQIVGDGPIYDQLVSKTKSLGLANVVIFRGYQANPRTIVRNFDLYLLLSEHEACPLTFIEAFAERTPVAGFLPIGGVSEINDGISPLLESRDPSAVAEIALQLLEDPSKRNLQAKKAYNRYLENYTSNKMIQAIRKIYKCVDNR